MSLGQQSSDDAVSSATKESSKYALVMKICSFIPVIVMLLVSNIWSFDSMENSYCSNAYNFLNSSCLANSTYNGTYFECGYEYIPVYSDINCYNLTFYNNNNIICSEEFVEDASVGYHCTYYTYFDSSFEVAASRACEQQGCLLNTCNQGVKQTEYSSELITGFLNISGVPIFNITLQTWSELTLYTVDRYTMQYDNSSSLDPLWSPLMNTFSGSMLLIYVYDAAASPFPYASVSAIDCASALCLLGLVEVLAMIMFSYYSTTEEVVRSSIIIGVYQSALSAVLINNNRQKNGVVSWVRTNFFTRAADKKRWSMTGFQTQSASTVERHILESRVEIVAAHTFLCRKLQLVVLLALVNILFSLYTFSESSSGEYVRFTSVLMFLDMFVYFGSCAMQITAYNEALSTTELMNGFITDLQVGIIGYVPRTTVLVSIGFTLLSQLFVKISDNSKLCSRLG